MEHYNPYQPMDGRQPGMVGTPLSGVVVKIVPADGDGEDGDEGEGREEGREQEAAAGEEQGELRVKGPNLFRCYFGRPEQTAECFDEEGFFRTGDTVSKGTDGSFRILGRTSVDIIKMAGYKLSALEIEGLLLEHEGIGEVAVLGVPDDAYGELVGVVVSGGAGTPTLEELKSWAKERMALYKVPTRMRVLGSIPRNAMGKVNKKALLKVFIDDDGDDGATSARVAS